MKHPCEIYEEYGIPWQIVEPMGSAYNKFAEPCVPDPGFQVFIVHRLHIPTGRKSDVHIATLSREHLLLLLNFWNNDPRWKYWY